MMQRVLIAAVLAAWVAGSAVQAQTLAYWRHEEGPNGGLIPAGADTVLDSSGNGNHMRTFDPSFTSATYSNVVSPLPLRSGLPNTLSLDFGPGGDDGGLNDDNFTSGKPIDGRLFTAVTFEMAFRMDTVSGYQAIFGKDGKPLGDGPGEPDSPVPPLKFLVRGDDFPGGVANQLFVEWIDGDGDVTNVAGGATVVPNTWYHVAFTLDASSAALYVAGETGPYQLRQSLIGQDFAGPGGEVIISEPLGFSTGRGMFNNSVGDWADAHIDEVRISQGVLRPDQFLFVAVPEPGTAALATIGCLGLLRRRREEVGPV